MIECVGIFFNSNCRQYLYSLKYSFMMKKAHTLSHILDEMLFILDFIISKKKKKTHKTLLSKFSSGR